MRRLRVIVMVNKEQGALRESRGTIPMSSKCSTHIQSYPSSELSSRQTCKGSKIFIDIRRVYLPLERPHKDPDSWRSTVLLPGSPRFIRRRGPQRPGTLSPHQLKWRRTWRRVEDKSGPSSPDIAPHKGKGRHYSFCDNRTSKLVPDRQKTHEQHLHPRNNRSTD